MQDERAKIKGPRGKVQGAKGQRAVHKIRTPLRVETLSFGEAAGFIPQR
jgi:hypothetical protein